MSEHSESVHENAIEQEKTLIDVKIHHLKGI